MRRKPFPQNTWAPLYGIQENTQVPQVGVSSPISSQSIGWATSCLFDSWLIPGELRTRSLWKERDGLRGQEMVEHREVSIWSFQVNMAAHNPRENFKSP